MDKSQLTHSNSQEQITPDKFMFMLTEKLNKVRNENTQKLLHEFDDNPIIDEVRLALLTAAQKGHPKTTVKVSLPGDVAYVLVLALFHNFPGIQIDITVFKQQCTSASGVYDSVWIQHCTDSAQLNKLKQESTNLSEFFDLILAKRCIEFAQLDKLNKWAIKHGSFRLTALTIYIPQ